MIDAALQPNMLLQYTVSRYHRNLSEDTLVQLRGTLREREHMLVWIVPVLRFTKDRFPLQAGFGDMKQVALFLDFDGFKAPPLELESWWKVSLERGRSRE